MKTRSVLLIYGEQTETLSIRVPKSKKKEIEKMFQEMLKQYENPQRVEIDVANGKSVKNQIVIPADSIKEGDVIEFSAEAKLAPEKSTASGIDNWKDVRATEEEVAEVLGNIKVTPAIKFEQIASLPLGTKLVKEYGKFGALRSLEGKEFFTKRMNQGKIEILKHDSYESAVLYANENFK